MDDRNGDALLLAQAKARIRELEAENADLRESAQRYATLLSEAPIPILVHADYRIVFVNPAAVQAFGGASADDFLGTDVLERIDPETRELVRQRITDNYIKKGHYRLGNNRYRRLDGSLFEVEIMATMADWQGRPAAQVIFRDVTEERRTRDELRQSVEKYRLLAENAADVIWTVNVEGELTYISPSILKLRGLTSKEAMAETIPQTMTPASYAEVLRKAEDHARQGGRDDLHLELEQYRKDGSTVWVEMVIRPLFDASGNKAGFLGVSRDVTRRRAAQEALRQSEERFRAFFDNVEDMIYYQGLDGSLSMLNRASSFITGYPAADFEKDPQLWRRIIHPDDVRDADDFFRRYPDGVPYYEVTYRLRAKDGQTKWIESRMYGAKDTSGKYVGYHCIDRDVTERTALERSLVEARDRAEEASRAKNAFLATMSHEIRTPLNGIMGMLQLAEFTELSAEQEDYLSGALTSCRNLMHVLNDILDIARIEAGALGLVTEDFPLAAVVDPVMELAAGEARRKGLALTATVAPDVPGILCGDPGRLRQVLFNLVGNAVKYTEAGAVHMEISRLPSCPLPGGVSLYVAIADTGIGIPEDNLAHVFEPFTQLETVLCRKHGGSGLGLSIVRRLLSLMGAACAVESREGQGTVFHLSIPLMPSPADLSQGNPALRPETLQARILVAEDDPVNLFTIMRFLEKLGHAPRGAADGQEALDLLRSEPFDCVLMDIQMPGRNGLETTRDIRSSTSGEFDPGIPIIALTAHAMSGDRETFLEAGMDAYLSKPVEMEALRAALGEVLRRDAT
ncbi:PAS domain S-box protein [Desulfovibrio sulfodismutans]|uniref:histidine kinase n=1 Tax=Desulfolutivibrio sulfodismutans TaxID=63561 RepID=A0A7K3NHQ2_9BACT|nr:PAS domain S-box protein [Desulfolutivibrio sulfodismutans]NDY55734.1 PAS domain S-box protein [Desulfolutivibrio sulfodismutans]QLA13753.1 PAS domain S-box protein [Desulfolutivibrio sulfodismutans DSM 3696]